MSPFVSRPIVIPSSRPHDLSRAYSQVCSRKCPGTLEKFAHIFQAPHRSKLGPATVVYRFLGCP